MPLILEESTEKPGYTIQELKNLLNSDFLQGKPKYFNSENFLHEYQEKHKENSMKIEINCKFFNEYYEGSYENIKVLFDNLKKNQNLNKVIIFNKIY